MGKCILCSTKLRFSNTPLLGAGKLNDGSVICTDCFKKVYNTDPQAPSKLRYYSPSDVRDLLGVSSKTRSADTTSMSRLDEIKQQIKSAKLDDVSSFLGRKEIRELPEILDVNEIVDNIVQGTYNDGMGILVSTNRRLVFVDKGFMWGLKVEDFPLDKITSIQYETSILSGKIKIHISSNVSEIKNVEKSSARKFAEFVRKKISEANNYSKTILEPAPPVKDLESDVFEKIEKLGKLKSAGLLSEEEFTEQKNKLLNKL